MTMIARNEAVRNLCTNLVKGWVDRDSKEIHQQSLPLLHE